MDNKTLIIELSKGIKKIDDCNFFMMDFNYYINFFVKLITKLKLKDFEGGGVVGEWLDKLFEMNFDLGQFSNLRELKEKVRAFRGDSLEEDGSLNLEKGMEIARELQDFNLRSERYFENLDHLDGGVDILGEIDRLPNREGLRMDWGEEEDEELFKKLHEKAGQFAANKDISHNLDSYSMDIARNLKDCINQLVEAERFGSYEEEEDEGMDPEVDYYGKKVEINRVLYVLLHGDLGLSDEYIKELIKYLIKNGKYPKSSDVSDWDLNLLRLIGGKYNIEQLTFDEFAGIVYRDLNFLGKKFGNDEEVMNYLRTKILNRFVGHISGEESTWNRGLVLESLKSIMNTPILGDNLKRIIYTYVNKGYETINGLKLLNLMTKDLFVRFIGFYDQFVNKIDLGMLNSGKFYKFNEVITSLGFDTTTLNSILGAVKELGVKDDDKIIGMLSRGGTILRMLHNNGHGSPDVNPGTYEFIIRDSYFTDLFLAMMGSKWDLNQDVVDKFINIGLNNKIDEVDRNDSDMNEIAGRFGINLDSFRNSLIEFRQILAGGQEIPFSWKEKIFKIDNDLQTLLSGKLLIQYIDKAKPKDMKVLNLNYEMNDGLRFEVLPDKSLEYFRVGAATQCCQRPGGAAESSMIDSFINPLAGVLVLKKGREIIAQSYFHYVPGDNGYILDNVEANVRLVKKYEINLDNLYANLAKKIKEDTGAAYIKCGKGYNKLKDENFGTGEIEGDPRFFELDDEEVYSDFNAEDHLDLLNPKIPVMPVTMTKKIANKIDKLLKLAERFEMMIRFGV